MPDAPKTLANKLETKKVTVKESVAQDIGKKASKIKKSHTRSNKKVAPSSGNLASVGTSVTRVGTGRAGLQIHTTSLAQTLANYVSAGPPQNDKLVTDPNFSQDKIEKIDERVKVLLMAMMFLATMILGVFVFWVRFVPPEIFASDEVRKVFLPTRIWSGVSLLIVCPWFCGLYCLFLVVYPDPRKWTLCWHPRRTRWIPYITTLLYTLAVNSYWIYEIIFIPSTLREKMKVDINDKFENLRDTFPKSWVYLHNYYQCCGMTSKVDWKDKLIPTKEYPYPFKEGSCTGLKYGVSNAGTGCVTDSRNAASIGVVWPASCCNNLKRQHKDSVYTLPNTIITASFCEKTTGCTSLPSSTQVWKGICLHSEIAMALSILIVVIVLSMSINVVGGVVFWKVRILESAALHQKLEPPKPHI